MIIDDFTSGSHTIPLTSGTDRSAQSGSMLGGNRTTWLWINSHYGHPGSLTIGSSRLILSTGAYVHHRLEVAYGYNMDFSFTPLPADVLSGHERFRVNFESNDLPLNSPCLSTHILVLRTHRWGRTTIPSPIRSALSMYFLTLV